MVLQKLITIHHKNRIFYGYKNERISFHSEIHNNNLSNNTIQLIQLIAMTLYRRSAGSRQKNRYKNVYLSKCIYNDMCYQYIK